MSGQKCEREKSTCEQFKSFIRLALSQWKTSQKISTFINISSLFHKQALQLNKVYGNNSCVIPLINKKRQKMYGMQEYHI